MAKKFKANQFTAMAMVGALVYSATVAVIPGADGHAVTLKAFTDGGGGLTFLGIPVIIFSYLSAVIPTVVAVWILSLVERVLRHHEIRSGEDVKLSELHPPGLLHVSGRAQDGDQDIAVPLGFRSLMHGDGVLHGHVVKVKLPCH